ncbi:MAG TPA: nucleoside hydrolase [Kofleriaceae bacterium]|jgi:inosine-uridine nucleoside N-ribohydrolase|nr:nucleoside hydrolase [Kofleriaceae bacterium]
MSGLIIDTDVGFDDLLAILYLLAQPGVQIEAFTVVNGISDPLEGADALLRMQEMIGELQIPVYLGATQPMSGSNAFPSEWRHQASQLGWGTPSSQPQAMPASAYLSGVLAAPGQVAILAIGPLTNLGTVLQSAPPVATVQPMSIMGGAINVAGNIPAAPLSEGNMYVDPLAAHTAFAAGLKPVLVPLDACNMVPIDNSFLGEFFAIPEPQRSPLWSLAAQVLEQIASQFVDPPPPTQPTLYFAYDPLAGVSIADLQVLTNLTATNVAVEQGGDNPGQTTAETGAPNAQVAMGADSSTFRAQFMAAFTLPSAAR